MATQEIDDLYNEIDANIYTNEAEQVEATMVNGVMKDMVRVLSNGANLEDGSITSVKIGAGEIKTNNLANNVITATKLSAGSVTSGALQVNSVLYDAIRNGAVGTEKIAGSAVTETKLASNAVTTVKIADKSVTKAKLADDVVFPNVVQEFGESTTDVMSQDAVTKTILDAAETLAEDVPCVVAPRWYQQEKSEVGRIVTYSDISEGYLPYLYKCIVANTDQVWTPENWEQTDVLTLLNEIDFNVADGSITTAKLADKAITGSKIADYTIGTTNYRSGSINNAALMINSVRSGNLSAGSVTLSKLGSDVPIPVDGEVYDYVDSNTFTLLNTPKMVWFVFIVSDNSLVLAQLNKGDYTISGNTITINNYTLTDGMSVRVHYFK